MEQLELEIQGAHFRFTALGSEQALNLLFRLLKQTEGVMSQVKLDMLHAFNTTALSDQAKLGLGATLGIASTVEQVLANTKPEFVDKVMAQCMEKVEIKVSENSEGQSIWGKPKADKRDFFQNRIGLQTNVLIHYLKWTYADFLEFKLSETVQELLAQVKNLQRQVPSGQSTGGTTESSPQSNTEDSSSPN